MRRRNNRPIRTRPPGKRRPVRWIDAYSSTPGSPVFTHLEPGSIGLPATAPTSAELSTLFYRELVVGDIDAEWADATEVLVERLVGDITITGRSLVGGLDDGLEALQAFGGRLFPIVRMGILVLEESEAEPAAPPTLWEADDLEDGEWMWLWQLGSPNENHMLLEGPDAIRLWSHDVHLDLRVKRKLGRRDRLVLCHEFTTVAALSGTHTVDVQPLLRCLVSTK